MDSLFLKLKRAKKKFYSKKGNIFVKKYYKNFKDEAISFERNIWKNNVWWDYFYQCFPGNEKSSLYVPMDYYNYKVLPNLNDAFTKIYVQDKNMFDNVFGDKGVRIPDTLFRCINYNFLTKNYKKIDDIETFLKGIDQDFIIKVTRQSGGGKGVDKYLYKNGSLVNASSTKTFQIDQILKDYKGDFIVQEVIKQHNCLGKFHPNSVNTIKIMTYRSVVSNEVSILLAELRIGRGSSFVDNTGQGGMAVGVDIDVNYNGVLRKHGFVEVDDFYTEHPDTQVSFQGSKVDNFDKLVQSALRLADVVPHQRLIGWDFSIDVNGEPIMIESNYGSGIDILQLVNGKPIFGKYSHEVKQFLDKI